MKRQLIFIDNDHKERSEEDVDRVKDSLSLYGNVDDDQLKNIKIISDFRNLDISDQIKMIEESSEKGAICTWSMYTNSHFNSAGQMYRLLSACGRYNIKNVVYIDTSGNLERFLDMLQYDSYRPITLNLLKGIENNFILTNDYDDLDNKNYFRLRVDLLGEKDYLNREEINLNDLLTY